MTRFRFLPYALVLFAISLGEISSAIELENRPLVPTSARSPAEAGLESGRYQAIPRSQLETWERQQDAILKKSEIPTHKSGKSRPTKVEPVYPENQ